MLLNNQWIIEEIKKYLETNESENTMIQNLRTQQNSSQREVCSNTNLPQETREVSNK